MEVKDKIVPDEQNVVRFVIGLENATLEQKMVFCSVIEPELVKVLDRFTPLVVNA